MKSGCGERLGRVVIGAAVLALTSGCAARLGAPASAPTTLGDRAVGVTRIQVDDPSGYRRLTVEVWYPAEARSMDPHVVYEVESMGMTAARIQSVARAHRDVAPLHSEGPRPLVVFSHGRGSTRFANASLAEVLASHGYVVAAPDHPGHTMDAELTGISDVQRSESAFADLVDLSRVAVAGHSFHALAALGATGAGVDTTRQARECREGHDDWRCSAVPVFGATLAEGKGPYRAGGARADEAGATPPGARRRSDADVTRRLAFIEGRFEAGRPAAERWSYGWFTAYAGAAVVHFSVALGTTDPGLRADMAVGAFTSAIGVLPFAVFPFTPRFAGAELEALSANTPAERARKLRRAERLLAKSADQEAFGKGWMMQVGVLSVNVGIGLGLALGYDRVKSGISTTLIGIAVSEFQIFTEPTQAIDDWDAYQRGDLDRSVARPAVQLRVAPAPGGIGLGASF